MKLSPVTFLLPWLLLALACQPNASTEDQTETPPTEEMGATLPDPATFAGEIDGQMAELYPLEGPGIKAAFTNYGARVVSILVKDTEGVWTDVVLGFNTAQEFKDSGEPFYGATIGRYGNRIAGGQFTIAGETYQFPINNDPNTLHGGPGGYHNVMWTGEMVDDKTLKFTYTSPDGEEGFPGTVENTVVYTLTEEPGLHISFEAVTDAPTHLNLTNHAFFNLNGEGTGTINDHQVQIMGDRLVAVDGNLIPTGELMPVEGTPFDFTEMTRIGDRLDVENEQLELGRGYDHTYVISEMRIDSLQKMAVAVGDKSGIRMEVYSQEPGVQFYGGNFMTGEQTGKAGGTYDFRTAFCFEPQHFPDSPNQPTFPSTLLQPGEVYQTAMKLTFGTVE
jgi:aldose 1-epimerase